MSLAPYRTLARFSDCFEAFGGRGLVERERRGQLVVGVDLRLEISDLLLGEGDGIGAGDEAASASARLVTSSLTTRRSSKSPTALATASGSRAVPTTAWAGGEGGFDEIDAHATAGSSNEPDLLVSHGISLHP